MYGARGVDAANPAGGDPNGAKALPREAGKRDVLDRGSGEGLSRRARP